jgi:superfamily II DNA or RNA helicase
MTYLPEQATYHAHRLVSSANAEEAFTRSLTSARVEMNPHQVNAALFALRSPLSKGVLLADEVGLGKTIEAGLVISQRWAEHKRRILLVVPASLRKQWSQELHEKFSLPSQILEAKTYKDMTKAGRKRPFETPRSIIICSYEFAARRADEVRAAKWDLVVFDEAHRLRNVHKKGAAKNAKALKEALGDRFKILLTATPLQNNLTELYGLVSIIDETHFGGEHAFKAQYTGAASNPASQQLLRERLEPICNRTLRRQVQEAGHINFRKRHAVTFRFEASEPEQQLYEALSEYLRDPTTIAYGGRNNPLVLLQARKVLGSSTFAVARYLDSLVERLRQKKTANIEMMGEIEEIDDLDLDEFDDIDDESEDEVEPEFIDPEQLANELGLVEAMRDLAHSITENAKGQKLIENLPLVLDEIEGKGGKRKAVIFTESTRTQRYLADLLSDNGYDGQVVLMNGSNSDPESREIYRQWKEKHADTDRISGSKTADMKAAIVEAFKSDEKSILIATESGAEGINLQFCSLLINYDLPWNPQRVEQRIGRCHRYGQLVDVTVVNMLNMKNGTEARIHELLEQKLHLFDGVFGASDEVLGILIDGIDFEREVLRIVQDCRSAEEADREFDELTAKIQDSIDADMEMARSKALEHLDADVVSKLHRRDQVLAEIVPEFERRLLMVAHGMLPEAQFPSPDSRCFDFQGKRWTTDWKEADEHDWQFFRANEGLGAQLIEEALSAKEAREPSSLIFDPSAYAYTGQLGGVADLGGKSGWLRVLKAVMPVEDAPVEEIIVVALTDSGELLPPAVGDKLMMAPAISQGTASQAVPADQLDAVQGEAFESFSKRVREESYKMMLEEEERLSRYASDMELEIQAKISAMDEEIRDLDRTARNPNLTMEETIKLKREKKKLQNQRDDLVLGQHQQKRKVRDEIDARIDEIEAMLMREPQVEEIMTLRWQVQPGALQADRVEAA